jgi:hypothetical protein
VGPAATAARVTSDLVEATAVPAESQRGRQHRHVEWRWCWCSHRDEHGWQSCEACWRPRSAILRSCCGSRHPIVPASQRKSCQNLGAIPPWFPAKNDPANCERGLIMEADLYASVSADAVVKRVNRRIRLRLCDLDDVEPISASFILWVQTISLPISTLI